MYNCFGKSGTSRYSRRGRKQKPGRYLGKKLVRAKQFSCVTLLQNLERFVIQGMQDEVKICGQRKPGKHFCKTLASG